MGHTKLECPTFSHSLCKLWNYKPRITNLIPNQVANLMLILKNALIEGEYWSYVNYTLVVHTKTKILNNYSR